MVHVKKVLEVAERRACLALGQHRSTQRYQPQPKKLEEALVKALWKLSRKHPRYGYRRAWRMLLRDGWRVNRKRVQRLWRREGLKVPRKQVKRRRVGSSANGILRRKAEYVNHVWTYDFIFDQDAEGRLMKILTVVDEFSRRGLAIVIGRHMRARDVIKVLIGLFHKHGIPGFIRSDNGPEFIAKAIREWLATSKVGPLFIAPGAPWENAFIESFHSRLRDEFLNRELFSNADEAHVLAQAWLREYNQDRPHSSLDGLTPAEFAASQSGRTKTVGNQRLVSRKVKELVLS